MGCCEWFEKLKKRVGAVSLHFDLEAHTLDNLSAPQRKKIYSIGVKMFWTLPRNQSVCGRKLV